MTDYKVEKNIPYSTRASYPFEKMFVGDSFEFPIEEKIKITAAASYFGTRHVMKFSVRKNRCWRTK